MFVLTDCSDQSDSRMTCGFRPGDVYRSGVESRIELQQCRFDPERVYSEGLIKPISHGRSFEVSIHSPPLQ